MNLLFLILFFLTMSTSWSQEVHFFGSLDYARTTTKKDVEYNGYENKLGASYLSTAGINVSAKVDDRTQALIQVIHHPLPNKIAIDLIQVQRTFKDQWKLRVGQQRLPTFLKSEVIQIKSLYPWTMAPAEVYNQNPLRSFTGASLEKQLGDFSVQTYFGDVKEQLYQRDSETTARSKQLMGMRLNYNKDGLETYFNALKSQTDITVSSPVDIAPSVSANAKIKERFKNSESLSTGFGWNNAQWLIMSEFIHVYSTNAILRSVDGAYASIGRNLNEKFLLLGTFSNEFSRKSNLSPSKTTTYDLTLQYTINMNTVLKLGARHVNYRRRVVSSNLSPTGQADSGLGFTGAPGNNFNVFDLQLAFIF